MGKDHSGEDTGAKPSETGRKPADGDSGTRPVDARVARRRQDPIGRRLRQMYDEVVNEEFIYEETSRTVSWIYQNNFSINPFNIKYENLRLVMEQFKVICCTPPEILNENLKSRHY